MFGRIKRVLEKSRDIDYNSQMQAVFSDRKVQQKIIDLNTISQLFDKGEDATGRRLDSIGGGYAPLTILEKTAQGLPTDRVTLSDTFTFYDSFTILAGLEGFSISYDPIKEGEDLRIRWGENIAGLSSESVRDLQDFTLPIVKDSMLSYVLNQ